MERRESIGDMPEIRRVLATGYPRAITRKPRCARCGQEIESESFVRLFGVDLCDECVEYSRVWNEGLEV